MTDPRVREACGIVGITTVKPIFGELCIGLRALQHRGQESAGIAVHTPHGLQLRVGMGLVASIFRDKPPEFGKPTVGIGHVRYSTAGSSTELNAQPIRIDSAVGTLAIAHNGTIANQHQLKADRLAAGWAFTTETDSEIIARLIANQLSRDLDIISAIKRTLPQLVGSYSLTIMVNDRLFGIRDPLGIKPLCIGFMNERQGHALASESVALDAIHARLIRDVAPGEIVELTPTKVLSHGNINSGREKAHCMFEYVYFARPDAVLDEVLVYRVRRSLGRALWQERPTEADVVVPIPDSGTACALGYCFESGLPYREGLIKNRYVWRTFIMPEQDVRRTSVREKLNPIRELLEGERVVLVDDSIVRGTTMSRIVAIVREAGAKEVHVRIGCPPIISPCYLGIDMPTREEFIAPNKDFDQIAREVGADSVHYISIPGLIESIGKEGSDLCLGCLTEQYPVPIEGERLRGQPTLEEFANGKRPPDEYYKKQMTVDEAAEAAKRC